MKLRLSSSIDFFPRVVCSLGSHISKYQQKMLSAKVSRTVLSRVQSVALMQVANKSVDRYGIGNREVVGWGVNAIPHYYDRYDFPFPAVRFKEIKGDLIPLKEKEKKDWKSLSLEEKKALYRASFCQTFAEMEAPTGEWKSVTGWTLFFVAMGVWLMMGVKHFVSPPLPESFSEESRRAQFRRSIDLRTCPISGPLSKWDYEKDDWKK